MRHPIKVYLNENEIVKLKIKAKACGFDGKGYLSHYISKVANENIIFLSDDILSLLNNTGQKSQKKFEVNYGKGN